MNSTEAQALPPGWTLFPSADALAQGAAEWILELAATAIAEKGAFHLVTAGGSTPNRCYQLLATSTQAQWQYWHIYMGDERALPAGDEQRNDSALRLHWLDHVPIPGQQVHLMQPERGLKQACTHYEQQLPAGAFDLVLLGMGEDGHTASLFPGHPSLQLAGPVLVERASPKPPASRLTLSAARLSHSLQVLKLVSGASKQAALHAWLGGAELPIARIQGHIQTRVYLDRQAAGTG